MIIAFIGIGMVFGAAASGYALLAGGSFLMALAIYSGVGFVVVLSAIALALLASGLRYTEGDWANSTAERHPVSA
ncbi:MAG: hypothetical protein WBN04_20115 [Paracoccaceae bacterium]